MGMSLTRNQTCAIMRLHRLEHQYGVRGHKKNINRNMLHALVALNMACVDEDGGAWLTDLGHSVALELNEVPS